MQVIQRGSTDVTLAIRLFDTVSGAPKTGLTITDLNTRYIRVEDDNDVTISAWESLTALASLTASHSDNAGYEIGSGYYRIDFPDAVFATEADQVTVLVSHDDDTILVESREIQLVDYNPVSTITTLDGKVDQSLSATEDNIRGSDDDNLKDISDEIAALNDDVDVLKQQVNISHETTTITGESGTTQSQDTVARASVGEYEPSPDETLTQTEVERESSADAQDVVDRDSSSSVVG